MGASLDDEISEIRKIMKVDKDEKDDLAIYLPESLAGLYTDAPSRDLYEIANNISDQGKRRMCLLDNGEYTTIVFESQSEGLLLSAITALYQALDMTISIKPTDVKATPGEQALIVETCGRVFNDVADGIYDAITSEAQAIIQYHQVAKRHGKIVEPKAQEVSPWLMSSHMNTTPASGEPSKELAGMSESQQFGYASCDWSEDDLGTNAAWTPGRKATGSQTHVLLNDLYNVALIFEEVVTTGSVSAEQVCEEYPEFKLISTVTSPPQAQLDLFKQLFHKKSFTNREELDEKLSSFKKLFDINNDESDRKVSDSELVKNALKTYFVVSDDASKKMRAKDLIEQIMLKVTAYSPTLKKNLPGLLLENGLKKTRSKAGYHYYGIAPSGSHIERSKLDFEGVVERRQHELEPVQHAPPGLYSNSNRIPDFDGVVERRQHELEPIRANPFYPKVGDSNSSVNGNST